MREHVDGYLTRRIQSLYPDALILKLVAEEDEQWVLRRQGYEDIGLGPCFKAAKSSVLGILNVGRLNGN